MSETVQFLYTLHTFCIQVAADFKNKVNGRFSVTVYYFVNVEWRFNGLENDTSQLINIYIQYTIIKTPLGYSCYIRFHVQ